MVDASMYEEILSSDFNTDTVKVILGHGCFIYTLNEMIMGITELYRLALVPVEDYLEVISNLRKRIVIPPYRLITYKGIDYVVDFYNENELKHKLF